MAKKKKSDKTILYKITCGQCSEHLYNYRKNGKGALLRCYVSGIYDAPKAIMEKLNEANTKSEIPNIHCYKCNTLIAVPTVVKKNGKLALRMIQGGFHREKI